MEHQQAEPAPLVVGQSANKAATRGSASGKPRRLYKCRHCGFETDEKVENWQHIRIHMRPEKLLACGSCQFVTEYKHHLEYHQRNHSGYKPFKCDNCDYQCVNKSMLNSHMKSHSSIYLYQCGDCRYATKYVHSLKMHLRKYNHQPAQLMIDVYGRKRGPKSSTASLVGSPGASPNQTIPETINDATDPNSIQDEHTSSILDLRVNKSMLNSHTSLYLYQCGDCRYATKYVQSLKMHLDKYSHQPSQLMIDIYDRKQSSKSSSASELGSPDASPNHTTTKTITVPTTKGIQPEQTNSILDLRIKSKLVR